MIVYEAKFNAGAGTFGGDAPASAVLELLKAWFKDQHQGKRIITKITVAMDNGPAAEFILKQEEPDAPSAIA